MSSLRKRILSDEWVILAPDRAARPRQISVSVDHDAEAFCPFCPENHHVTPPTIATWSSPSYPDADWGVRALPNKFPALRVESSPRPRVASPYEAMAGIGAHEILIEAPDHCRSWHELPEKHLPVILAAWQERIDDLRGDPRLRCAQIFKNQGATAGATLEHAHSQLMALPILPPRLQQELQTAQRSFEQHGTCLICEMVKRELDTGERIVLENDQALAIAPYASRMPFEIWIIPRHHRGDFARALPFELAAVAELVRRILPLWQRACGTKDHNLILHSLPFDFAGEPYYHWHLEMLPRIGQVAGFEWGSQMYINATPSEVAARHLRQLAS